MRGGRATKRRVEMDLARPWNERATWWRVTTRREAKRRLNRLERREAKETTRRAGDEDVR